MQIINHFSFLLLAAAMLLIGGWIILHRTMGLTRWLSLGALTLGLIFSYSIFSPGPGDTTADITQSLRAGAKPVLLEFESPFCLGCIAAQPLLDQIKREHADQLEVVQINILSPDSARLKDLYRVQFTPTFVFLTTQGEEAWRSIGAVDPEQVRSSIEGDS
jgi:thiol-disulfide isomerase/thioredoxin